MRFILLLSLTLVPAQSLQDRVADLVAKLGADDYPDRQEAQEKLIEMGEEVLPLLEKHRGHEDPEVRARILAIFDHFRPPEGFPARSIAWEGVFGRKRTGTGTYTLLGAEVIRATASDDMEDVIATWLTDHPDARAIPISRLGAGTVEPESARIYVWLKDGEDHLNLDLVRKGCCPAGTMEAPGETVLVPRAEYDAFLQKAFALEKEAEESRLGIWGRPDYLREKHEGRARDLKKEKKWEEAIAELEKALEFAREPYQHSIKMSMAECYDRGGKGDEALALYDEIIGGERTYLPHYQKALCLSRHKGSIYAEAWLKSEIEKDPGHIQYHEILGRYYRSQKRHAEALAAYRVVHDHEMERLGARFDGRDHLILDEIATLDDTDIATLAEAIRKVTSELYALKRYEVTYRLATRGLSVRQEFRRRLGWMPEEQVKGGDTDFRFFRAVCHTRWSEFDAAQREIDHLRAAIGTSNYTGHKRRLESAEIYLRQMMKKRGKSRQFARSKAQ